MFDYRCVNVASGNSTISKQSLPIKFISTNNIFFLQGFDSIQLPRWLVLGQQHLKENREAVLPRNLLFPYWIDSHRHTLFPSTPDSHSQNQAEVTLEMEPFFLLPVLQQSRRLSVEVIFSQTAVSQLYEHVRALRARNHTHIVLGNGAIPLVLTITQEWQWCALWNNLALPGQFSPGFKATNLQEFWLLTTVTTCLCGWAGFVLYICIATNLFCTAVFLFGLWGPCSQPQSHHPPSQSAHFHTTFPKWPRPNIAMQWKSPSWTVLFLQTKEELLR